MRLNSFLSPRNPAVALVLIASTVIVASPALSTPADNLNPLKPPPETAGAPAAAPAVPLPGDTMDDPLPVPSLPFIATGNNCAYADDYAWMCPYGNSAPDVVYAFIPTVETNIRVGLCDSGYDTLLLIYHTDGNPVHIVACNDDLCGVDGYRSAVERLHVVPGFTYYFVVDGYVSYCGDYILRVDDLGPCIPDCTEIWEPEGEPTCFDEYVDEFNAGCDAYPTLFRTIAPSDHIIRICGTSGWFWGDGHLQTDRDWYEIQVEHTNWVDIFCQAEFDVALWLFDIGGGCGLTVTLDQDNGLWCDNIAAVSAELAPGRYWILVEPEAGTGGCGLGYRLWIDGYTPAPTAVGEEASFSVTRLHPPAPNPFRGTTEIRYTLARSGTLRILIHDLRGRLVRSLASEIAPAGPGHLTWDGKDDAGRAVASGVYECRLVTKTGTVVRPIIRLR